MATFLLTIFKVLCTSISCILLIDLQSIADSLEAHKTDYAVVADMQTENVRLREELLKMTEENERLRNQLESLKRSQGAEVESLKAANDEKGG